MRQGADSLFVALPRTVISDSVQVAFDTRVLLNATVFPLDLGLAARPGLWQSVEPAERRSNIVMLPELIGRGQLIDDLQLTSPVFSPNGDGINDQLQVSYILLRALSEVPINVTLYDLSGRTVRRLQNSGALNGPQLLTWDGRNEDGAMAPPGMYLLRLSIDTDTGSENRTLLVGLAY